MSLISTVIGVQETTSNLSAIEMKIKKKSDQIMALTQEAQQAIGDQEKLQELHQINTQLEQDLHMLNAEYDSLKQRIEEDKKMRKEASKRAFSA